MTEVAAPLDAEARQRAVETHDSVLVQAPAGSGKTTLLAQRYLRLLASVDAPERILALTFTRRAAEEMRLRVLGALEAAALPECPADLNRRTFELARAARRHLAAVGIDVERHPARLRIETIDSFNAWLAAQLPITAGAGGRLALIEDARVLYEEASRRALAHDAEDVFGTAVERVLAVGDQRWNQLLELIVEMLPSRDRWLPLLVGRLQAASAIDPAQLERVRAHFDQDLELLVTRDLKRAYETLGREALGELQRCLPPAARRLDARHDLAPWALDTSALRPSADDLPRWRGLVEVLLTGGGAVRAKLDKRSGFPPDCAEKRAMSDLLEQFARTPAVRYALGAVRALPEPHYSDDDWERVRHAAQLLVLAAAQLDAVFREHGAVDFPAVSMAAQRALGSAEAPTDLALRLDYRLQHLLLDEFQDTSSAQLELVRVLTAGWTRGDGRSVFCVGDPMQSIYGFRQAEVRAFLELAEEGIGETRFEVERLTSNFRSQQHVVEWINTCFAQVLPRTDDRERGAIAFRRSQSIMPSAASAAPVSCSGFASRAAEARALTELIAARRREHPDWRIAVLVRGRVHAREIAHSLRDRQIAFRALEIEPLQDRAAVRDLVVLICALLHRADRSAWLALLRAPWAGLELADLLKIARADAIVWETLRNAAVLERLSEHGRERCSRIRAVLEAAFEVRTHSSVTRWVERVWLALGGPCCAVDARELTHVRAVFSRLRELEEQGLPDAADLASRFADLYADGDPADAVEIMTIHKSKGLEFDCVLVPALDRHVPVYRGQLLLAHAFSRAARPGMVMAARPAVGERDNALFGYLCKLARDAASLESERLLYVACTRAKHELHLSATVASREDPDAVPGEEGEEVERPARPGALITPRTGSLLRVLWNIEDIREQFAAVRPAVASNGDPAEPELAEAELAGLRGGPISRVPRGWSPPPIRSTLKAPIDIAPETEREETPVFDWAGETARRIGSLVHAELQLLDLGRSDEAAIRARAGHYRRWLALHGVPAERLDGACERVIEAMVRVHRDPRAAWIFKAGYRDDFREHALSGHWRGEVVHAIFDRSFIDEHGIRWVIDYKTSQHSGGGLEEFLGHEVQRYRPQLERYAALAQRLGPEPVRVGLYFPLMSAWREWLP